MKKNIFQKKTNYQKAVVFVCWLLLIFSTRIHAQATCSTATLLPSSDTNMLSQTANTRERWYQFTGSSQAYYNVWLFNNDTTGFTGLTLYRGTCSSLTAVATSISVGSDLNLYYGAIANGTTYFLKADRAPTTSVTFELNIQLNAAGYTPCSCPAVLYNSNNTCEAVCNGGLDYNTGGLNNWAQIFKACPWSPAPQSTATPFIGTSTTDLFAANSSISQVNVPNNFVGTQNSHSNPLSSQAGYAGIICYTTLNTYPTEYREYLEAPLQYTLQAGKTYTISFWISLADNSGACINNIGAFVQSGNIYQNSTHTVIGIPASAPNFVHTSVINDTSWIQISGTITANGGEDHIIIGQFSSNASSTINYHTPVVSNSTIHDAYYYIDDVSLVPTGNITVTSSPNPACLSTSISVIASCVNGNGNYSWTASSGTFTCNSTPCDTISTNATGATYSVTTTLPAYNSCTSTASYTPSTLAGPTNVNAGIDQTVCLGASATLNGTASGTYSNTSWSLLTGGTLCSGCTTTTATPPGVGFTSYIFTATNSVTGCTSTDTVKVTAVPLPVQIVSLQGAVTCDTNYLPFVTNPNSFSAWSWTTDAGNYLSTTNDTFFVSWNSNSAIGVVNVTVTDSTGCQGIAYLLIPTCCTTGSFVLTNTNTSANVTHFPLTSGYYTASFTSFSINGIYHVDANTDFKNCDVTFGPNAKIIVDPGIKLLIDKSNLYSCTDMWDGIYIDGTDTASEVIVVNGASIEDAMNAIVSTNGGKFTIDGSLGAIKMNKNYIGILVKPFQGTHPGTIRATVISCDAPGQPGSTAYTASGANCRYPVNGKSYAAIYIDSCSDITIGDSTSINYRNLMERQRFGIYAKNSNVKVWNNDLKYYITTSFAKKNSPLEGIAVYAKGSTSLTRTLTVGKAGSYTAHNLIQKCTYGVMVENHMNLYCEYNRLDSIQRIGIYALNNRIGRTIFINEDTLTEFSGTGINCTHVNASAVNITNNKLNETTSNPPTSFGITGIYVADAINLKTGELNIKSNSIMCARTGIWILHLNRAQVTDNSISLFSNQPASSSIPAIGIKMESSNSSMVRNNSIANNSTPTSAGYDKMFGISITNCYNDTITKNTITKCGAGLYMKGINNPSLIGCNNFVSNYYGIDFGLSNSTQTSVYISDQLRWSNPNYGTATPTGNAWTGTVSGQDMKGKISPMRNWWCNPSNVPTTSGMSSLSLTGSGNTPITIGTSDQCLALLNSVTTGSPAELRDAMLSGICKTRRTYDTLSAQYHYIDSVFAYQTLKDNPSWTSLGTADDSYYANWYATVSNTNVGKLFAVEDNIYADKLTDAASILAGISPNGTPESNRKTVLGVYLNTWAKDSMNLDSIQIATLTTIADMAPVTGGIAVYDARVMLFQEIHDSSALRLAPEQSYFVNGTVLPGHVYPNPTTGAMMINYELPEGQTGTLQLYDIAGRIIHSYTLSGATSQQKFSAEDVPAGLYFYTVFVNGNAVLSEKVIIIKQE